MDYVSIRTQTWVKLMDARHQAIRFGEKISRGVSRHIQTYNMDGL